MESRLVSETTIPTLQTHFEVDETEVEAALLITLRDALRPVTLGLSILYLILALGHLVVLPSPIKAIMFGVALSTALVNTGLHGYLRRHPLPLHLANPLGLALVLMVLVNSLLHLKLTADPLQTTNVILLIIAAGLLFLSRSWLLVTYGLCLGGWLIVALVSPPNPAWMHFGFALLSSVAVSAIAFSARRSSLCRLERLRIQERFQRAELQQRAIELETSIGVGQQITSIIDVDSLLQAVVTLIRERYGFYFVGIFLVDPSGEYLIARAATGYNARELVEREWRVARDAHSIIGWTATQRKPYLTNDVLDDPHYFFSAWVPNTRSELALPLMMGDLLLGVLDIQCERPGAFRQQDIPVMELLANQVAIALHNASLYHAEKSRRLLAETLYEVVRALSRTLDFSEVLNLILQQLAEIVPHDRAVILLRQPDDTLQAVAYRGFPPSITLHDIRVPIRDNDVFDKIRRSQRPLWLDDVAGRYDWQNLEGLPQARSWIGIPLVHSDTVIGMLSLAREEARPFTEEEVKLATTFGGQAAVTIANARLYQDLLIFNEKLESMVAERTEALQKAYNKLERLDRAKTDFIGVVAHELRTPLTVLQGYAQILQQDPALAQLPYQRQLAEGIYKGALRLHEIVNSMLDLIKVETLAEDLRPKSVDLSMLGRQVSEALRTALQERRLNLTMRWEEPDLIVQGDADMLRKALQHLLINAIKYTPDGGAIRVEGRRVSAEASRLGRAAIEIGVHDTGIGIAPEEQELIFLKFYQTGEVALHSSGKTQFKAGGPGLGLAIVKGIIEAHGGVIWVESPGYDEERCPGSHFYVQLPA